MCAGHAIVYTKTNTPSDEEESESERGRTESEWTFDRRTHIHRFSGSVIQEGQL